MKVGDWVAHEDGRVGVITLMDFNAFGGGRRYHLVDFQDNTFAKMTHDQCLTVLEPVVADILTAVNTNER
jgi:hypothetical protein